MSSRAAAILWLIPGLLCGLLTCAVFGGGGYSLWHTHSNVELIETRRDREEEELKKLQSGPLQPGAATRIVELQKKRQPTVDELNEATQYRYYALAIVLSGILPLLMTLPFLIMFVLKVMARKEAEEVEETASE